MVYAFVHVDNDARDIDFSYGSLTRRSRLTNYICFSIDSVYTIYGFSVD